MKYLMTMHMMEPHDYQLSFRINQLIQYYGKSQVFKTMLTPRRLLNVDDLSELERHVSNLYNTFSESCYFEIFELIFKTELKKVG